MSRTNFAKTNEYILDINNTYYMFKFYDEFVETLKECEAKAFYNDIEIDSEELFLENMENISQWTYKTINLNKNADFMHIKKTWENKVGKSIEKYFADIEEEVRQAFRFSERIWEGISSQLLERIRSYEQQIKTTMAVSVHIRRGDYLQNEEAYGGICTERYYKTAIEYVKKRQQDASFFVYTNDPDYAGEWILKNFGQEKERFALIEGTQEENGYLDLYLMSLCRHHILANSSFSWWGAYLNPSREKMVIVPHKWFGNQECRDIYMENMIRIAKEQS